MYKFIIVLLVTVSGCSDTVDLVLEYEGTKVYRFESGIEGGYFSIPPKQECVCPSALK